jgi:hypothetical protein
MPILTDQFKQSFIYQNTQSKKYTPTFCELTEYLYKCDKCKSEFIKLITLTYGHHTDDKCHVCGRSNYFNNFEFAVNYLQKHLPDSPLLEDYRTSLSAGYVNTVPIIKFVKHYVEFQKTLLGE